MNDKPNYKKGNRIELIRTLYANVALPYRSLRMYVGTTQVTQRLARKMEQEGLIEIVRKSAAGKYIVVKDYKRNYETIYSPYLDRQYLNACQLQMDEYSRCKEKANEKRTEKEKNKGRMERLLNMTETMQMMHLSNVSSYPDETVELKEGIKSGGTGQSVFYPSMEIKKAGHYKDEVMQRDGEKRVQTSRIYGMMISVGGVYAVYNISDKLIEWKQYGEIKMKNHIKQLTRECTRGKDIGCILLATDMKVYARVITNEYQKGHKGAKILLNIDYAYEKMYGLPTTKDGIEMLRIMQEENWEEEMEQNLLGGCSRDIRSYSVVCDARSEEDGYILLFCNGNIARLKLFLNRAVNAREDEQFSIYCFDYQLPLLAALEIGNTKVKAMSIYDYQQNRKGERRVLDGVSENNTGKATGR